MLIKPTSESGQICVCCKTFKSFSQFSIRNDSKTYRKNCKDCRNKKQRIYSKTNAGKLVQYLADQKRNKKFPNKRAARSAIAVALKNKTIVALPCFVCGDKAEAHHADYDKPLDVMWLCSFHHKQTHLIGK